MPMAAMLRRTLLLLKKPLRVAVVSEACYDGIVVAGVSRISRISQPRVDSEGRACLIRSYPPLRVLHRAPATLAVPVCDSHEARMAARAAPTTQKTWDSKSTFNTLIWLYFSLSIINHHHSNARLNAPNNRNSRGFTSWDEASSPLDSPPQHHHPTPQHLIILFLRAYPRL